MTKDPVRRASSRLVGAVVLILLAQPLGLPGASAQSEEAAFPSPAFGADGEPTWAVYPSPGDDRGGEAMVGMHWGRTDETSEAAFVQGGRKTYLALFDDNAVPAGVTWTNVTRPVFDLDDAWQAWRSSMHNPLLDTDHASGHTLAGAQVVRNPCTFLSYTSDLGQSWQPGAPGCGLPAVDFPTMAVGPPPASVEGPSAFLAYLCGWEPSLSTHCYRSGDGGRTWVLVGPVVPAGAAGLQCTQQSGRLHVGANGTLLLPFADCGGKATVFRSDDGGTSWTPQAIQGSTGGDIAFPPDVGMSTGGWTYLGASADDGAYVAVLDSEGNQQQLAGQDWLQVSSPEFYTGPFGETIEQTEFAGVVAGDDDRAAFAFYGAFDGSRPKNQCMMGLVWYLFIATTYDAGQTWTVARAVDDPVQGGGIGVYDPLATTDDCRNLGDSALEVEMGARGRVHVAYSDGCTRDCVGDPTSPVLTGAFDGLHTIARQSTGRGLLAEHDRKENAVELFVGPCGNLMDPKVTIETPRAKEVITENRFAIGGEVDRNPVLTELKANATGTDIHADVGVPLTLVGWGDCGYGALPDGSMHPDLYTCTWTPLEGDPVIEPNNHICGSRSADRPRARGRHDHILRARYLRPGVGGPGPRWAGGHDGHPDLRGRRGSGTPEDGLPQRPARTPHGHRGRRRQEPGRPK